MMSSNDVELNDVAFYDAIPISEITENSDGTFTATPSPSGLSEDIYFPVYITGDNGIYEYPSDHEGYGHVFGGNIEVNQVGYYTKNGVVMNVLGEVALTCCLPTVIPQMQTGIIFYQMIQAYMSVS